LAHGNKPMTPAYGMTIPMKKRNMSTSSRRNGETLTARGPAA
jgi:hypothetical protein